MQFFVCVWMYLLFWVEAAAVAVSWKCTCRFLAAERFFGRLARNTAAPLIVGLLAMALRLAVLPIEPVPVPTIHDEFSYLLAADTFAHGRLANATHPLWQHFETMWIEHQPTYASMYPPLQGLALAAGLAVTGMAFAGVWLSIGIMCAAICWALRGWFSPGWAFFGGSLAAIRLGIFSYWADSYWGGTLAAAGGALLLGALPRLVRNSRPRDAFLGAVGIVILANTRPYEGVALTLAVGLAAVPSLRRLKLRAVLPAALVVLLAAGAWMAYYNWRVFGSPLTLPHTIYRNTYAVARYFVFQAPLPEPHYRHESMRDFYMTSELPYFLRSRTPAGYLSTLVLKLGRFWLFFVGPVLTLPLLAMLWTWRSRRTRTFLLMAAVVAAAMSLVPWFMPHYAAPATALIWALLVQGMRALRHWRPAVARAIPVICVVMVAVRAAMALSPIPFVLTYNMTWATTWSEPLGRERITQRLRSYGGRHLVIVRYQPDHDPLKEYVFNAADIDGSDIVWARDMGAERNEELLRYFRSRRAWLLEVGRQPPELRPYSSATLQSRPQPRTPAQP